MPQPGGKRSRSSDRPLRTNDPRRALKGESRIAGSLDRIPIRRGSSNGPPRRGHQSAGRVRPRSTAGRELQPRAGGGGDSLQRRARNSARLASSATAHAGWRASGGRRRPSCRGVSCSRARARGSGSLLRGHGLGGAPARLSRASRCLVPEDARTRAAPVAQACRRRNVPRGCT